MIVAPVYMYVRTPNTAATTIDAVSRRWFCGLPGKTGKIGAIGETLLAHMTGGRATALYTVPGPALSGYDGYTGCDRARALLRPGLPADLLRAIAQHRVAIVQRRVSLWTVHTQVRPAALPARQRAPGDQPGQGMEV